MKGEMPAIFVVWSDHEIHDMNKDRTVRRSGVALCAIRSKQAWMNA